MTITVGASMLSLDLTNIQNQINLLINAGADSLVSGSTIFESIDKEKTITQLKS